MKKTFLIICLLFSLQNFAQISTSEEEYNYLTIGYPESLEKGLDFKQGYNLQKINSREWAKLKLELFALNDNNNVTKAYLVTYFKNDNKKDKLKFFCIPINNESLRKKYAYETSDLANRHAYQTIISDFLVDALQKK